MQKKTLNYTAALLAAFVGLALCVNYYYHTRDYAFGFEDAKHNPNNFSAMARGGTNQYYWLFPCWKPRVGGMLLSGALINTQLRRPEDVTVPTKGGWVQIPGGVMKVDEFKWCFAIYHTAWVALVFAALAWFLGPAKAVPAMALVACGLSYHDTPMAWYYHFPWDNPGILFFTLAWMAWERRRFGWMLAAMVVGMVFKETAVIPSFLFLCAPNGLTWRQRGGYVAATVAAFLAWKTYIGFQIIAGQWVFFTQQSFFFKESLTHGSKLPVFVLSLFETTKQGWNNFWFVGAGTVLAAALLPTTDKALKLLLVAFACAAFCELNTTNEWRTFGEVLPLAAVLVLRWLQRQEEAVA